MEGEMRLVVREDLASPVGVLPAGVIVTCNWWDNHIVLHASRTLGEGVGEWGPVKPILALMSGRLVMNTQNIINMTGL